MSKAEAARLARIVELLEKLDSYNDLRAACLLGLTDDCTPHPLPTLANAGLTLSAGATTRQLFEFAAPRLGKTRIDRELRDEVWPRLRELGIVQRSYVLTAKEARAEGRLIEYGVHRRAKSPNNGYALTEEARQLLLKTSDQDWKRKLNGFLVGDSDRRLRVLQHEAAMAAAVAPGDHSKLMRAAADALRTTRLPDYELVFIYDADGSRSLDEAERATMEHRAQTFLTGEALKLAMGNIHLGFNAKQLELEAALATAQADVHALQEEMQAAAVTDALEIQMAEQYLEQLEAAAPKVAEAVRLAASAEVNIAAAQQAIAGGLLNNAEILLDKAKAGNADPSKIAPVEQRLAKAKQEKKARDLTLRINAAANQPRAVRRIRELIAEAEAIGVADRVEPAARRALRIARDAANARFVQARPIADHLVAEGFVPVIGDGRIEAWKESSKNGAGPRGHASTGAHASTSAQRGSTWTLDRVMVLRGDVWATRTPRVPVTRQELPKQAERSRWFNHPPARDPAPTK